MNRRKTAICVLGALGLVALGALAVFLCKGRTPAAGAEDAVPHRWADSEYNAMLKARIQENADLAEVAGAARAKLRKAKEAGVSGEELAALQKDYDEALLAMERQRAVTQVKIATRMREDRDNGREFQQKKGN